MNFQRHLPIRRVTRVVVIDSEVPQDGWVGIELPEAGSLPALASPRAGRDALVIEAAPVAASWGWPVPADPAPVRPAAAVQPLLPAGGERLRLAAPAGTPPALEDEEPVVTRERLDGWLRRLKPPEAAPGGGAGERPPVEPDDEDPSPRRIPSSDLIAVGRPPQMLAPQGISPTPAPKSRSRAALRLVARHHRLVLLCSILVFAGLSVAFQKGWIGRGGIEVPSTWNDRTAIG